MLSKIWRTWGHSACSGMKGCQWRLSFFKSGVWVRCKGSQRIAVLGMVWSISASQVLPPLGLQKSMKACSGVKRVFLAMAFHFRVRRVRRILSLIRDGIDVMAEKRCSGYRIGGAL